MQIKMCRDAQEAAVLLERIRAACYRGELRSERILSYDNAAPDHVLDKRFPVCDLLQHFAECYAWSHVDQAAERLVVSQDLLRQLVEDCVRRGLLEQGASYHALRITPQGRTALERSKSPTQS